VKQLEMVRYGNILCNAAAAQFGSQHVLTLDVHGCSKDDAECVDCFNLHFRYYARVVADIGRFYEQHLTFCYEKLKLNTEKINYKNTCDG